MPKCRKCGNRVSRTDAECSLCGNRLGAGRPRMTQAKSYSKSYGARDQKAVSRWEAFPQPSYGSRWPWLVLIIVLLPVLIAGIILLMEGSGSSTSSGFEQVVREDGTSFRLVFSQTEPRLAFTECIFVVESGGDYASHDIFTVGQEGSLQFFVWQRLTYVSFYDHGGDGYIDLGDECVVRCPSAQAGDVFVYGVRSDRSTEPFAQATCGF